MTIPYIKLYIYETVTRSVGGFMSEISMGGNKMLSIKWYFALSIITTWLILFTIDSRTFAIDVNYSDRGDRDEGVRSKPVGGSDFKLLGIRVNEGGHLDQSSSQINLSFWQPSPENVTIKVWEPKTNYWMIPHQNQTKSNKDSNIISFSWPIDPVIKPLNLDITKLQILVKNETENLYYPAQLFTRTHAAQGKNYQFIFKSEGGVSLEGTISRVDKNIPDPVAHIELEEEYPGIVNIAWNGLDISGKEVPTGIYQLSLKGRIYLSESSESIKDYIIKFIHMNNEE